MSMRPLLAIVALLLMAGSAAAQEIRPTLDKIKDSGAIVLGYRETSRPFSFLSENKPAGYSVDLCLEVAAALRQSQKLPELKVTWAVVTPGDRITKLVKGLIDLECGSTTITFGRMEQVAFSHMTFVDGGGLLVTTASGINSVQDLAGKRVGMIPNTTTDKALSSALTAAGIKVTLIAVSEHNEGLRGLVEGKFDAYASDRLLLAGLLTNSPDASKLKVSSELFSYEPYALMMRRGDNAFQASVNRTLSSLYRSGGIIKIYEKWFGPYASAGPLVKALYLLHSWPD